MKANLINTNQDLGNSKDLLKLGNQPKTSNKDFGSTLEKISSKTDNRAQELNSRKKETTTQKKSEETKERKVSSKDQDETKLEEVETQPKKKDNYKDVLALIQSLLVDVGLELEDIDIKLNEVIKDISIELDMDPLEVEQNLMDLLEGVDLEQFKTKGDFSEGFALLEKIESDLKLKSELNNEKTIDKNSIFEKNIDLNSLKKDETDNELRINNGEIIDNKEKVNNMPEDLSFDKNFDDIKSKIKEINPEPTGEAEIEVTNANEAFVPLIKDRISFNTSNKLKVEEVVHVEPKEIVEQIVNKVKVDLTDNKNHIKLSLKPEALGNMTMDIEVSKGGVVAKILVDNYRTKEIIESNIVQLKEGIEDTGMEIKTVEVHVGNNADFNHKEQRHFNFNQENKKFKNTNRLKLGNNYEDSIIVENNISNPNNPYEEDGFDLMA